KLEGAEIVGYVVINPAGDAAYPRLVVAIANSFHRSLVDYGSVLSTLGPSASPAAVMGYEQRISSTDAARRSQFVPPSQLIPIVQEIMSRAVISTYRIQPPTPQKDVSIQWLYENGGGGSLLVLLPGSGLETSQITNALLATDLEACKGGTVATYRLAPRYIE